LHHDGHGVGWEAGAVVATFSDVWAFKGTLDTVKAKLLRLIAWVFLISGWNRWWLAGVVTHPGRFCVQRRSFRSRVHHRVL
jgi:hypothetical protein